MGGLGAPFVLCPLSERRDFLGISGADGSIVLTTGKNMAIRYHVLEQKQETSWTSSRHWFTSRVVKCAEIGKYGAVLDNNTVAVWNEDDTAMGDVTKMKFSDPIWELNPSSSLAEDEGTLVIFENGFTTPLAPLLTSDQKKKVRKAIATGNGFVDTECDTIIDAAQCHPDKVVIISAPKKVGRDIVTRDVMKVTLLDKNTIVTQIEVKSEFVGHCILPGDDGPSILYLGRDGRLWQQFLAATLPAPSLVGSLAKVISPLTPVVLRPAPPSSKDGDWSKVVIYGSDPSEEGALIALYDLKYDIVVAKQSLKLYANPPIMDVLGGNVLIPVGLHILVISLYSSKSRLSGVVGKHGIRSGEEVFEQRSPFVLDPATSVGWTVDVEQPHGHHNKQAAAAKKLLRSASSNAEVAVIKKSFPEFWEVVQQYKILEREGQPQSLICTQILPLALTKGDDALDWMLQNFTDIPESHLIIILAKLLDNMTDSITTSHSLLDLILSRSVDPAQLVGALTSLDFILSRRLALYLKFKMESALTIGSESGDDTMSSSVLWLTSLLDAHYTHFVLGDELSLVEELLGVVAKGAAWLEAIAELEPYLILTQQKIDFQPRPNPHSKWRTEILTFT